MGQPRIVRGKGVVKMSKTILEKINNKIDKLEKEKNGLFRIRKNGNSKKKGRRNRNIKFSIRWFKL